MQFYLTKFKLARPTNQDTKAIEPQRYTLNAHTTRIIHRIHILLNLEPGNGYPLNKKMRSVITARSPTSILADPMKADLLTRFRKWQQRTNPIKPPFSPCNAMLHNSRINDVYKKFNNVLLVFFDLIDTIKF